MHSTFAVKPALPAAHDYAQRIRARLLRRVQELRKAMGLSNVHPGS